MASARQQAALDAAHRPAVRKRALATIMKQHAARAKLARIYNEPTTAFMKGRIRDTVARHEIPWSTIPGVLMKAFGKKEAARLVSGGTNGHDRGPGIGIPLDAIPARRKPGERGPDNGPRANAKGKAHPNAELIGKVIDLLAAPDTDKDRSDRLLAALDKLLL